MTLIPTGWLNYVHWQVSGIWTDRHVSPCMSGRLTIRSFLCGICADTKQGISAASCPTFVPTYVYIDIHATKPALSLQGMVNDMCKICLTYSAVPRDTCLKYDKGQRSLVRSAAPGHMNKEMAERGRETTKWISELFFEWSPLTGNWCDQKKSDKYAAILYDIYSDISCDSLSEILSGIFSCTFSGILSGILSGTSLAFYLTLYNSDVLIWHSIWGFVWHFSLPKRCSWRASRRWSGGEKENEIARSLRAAKLPRVSGNAIWSLW